MAQYRRKAELLEVDVAGDIVALDEKLGKCFGFNDVAAAVWRQLAEPRSFDELKVQLLSDYQVEPDQCEVELKELLDDMVEKHLIECTDNAFFAPGTR